MSDSKQKNLKLIIVVVIIIGVILYIESNKPRLNQTATDIIVPAQIATSTPITTQTPTSTVSEKNVADRSVIQTQKASMYPRAKEFADLQGFINTNPFKLSSIVGKKVVLIDFWTYSCINCLRTIPYLNAWYAKYHDLGLEIVGVHTPEFDFEKDYGNVSKAVTQLGIKYPVVLDSNQGTWNAYQNLYWPNEYLIDIDGFIVHNQIGEGDYNKTEQAIQSALRERDVALGLNENIPTTLVSPSDLISINASQVQSPETYFGAMRNEYLGNGNVSVTGPQTLSLPANINSNTLYLQGVWNFQNEYAESSSSNAQIEFSYNAKNVYMVASSNQGATLKVFKDGQLVNTLQVKDNKLYPLIQGTDYGQHILKIEVVGSGLQAYTFTFG